MNYCQKTLSAALLGIAALAGVGSPAWAQVVPPLGAAGGFAALGGTGVTCTSPDPAFTGITVSGGDVGSGSVVPTTVTGFPGFTPGANPCSLDPGRTPLLGQTAAIGALITAYNGLRDSNTCPRTGAEAAGHNLVGNLTSGSQGATLEPGVYCISGVGTLTSILTLNGRAADVWIFKASGDPSLTLIGGTVRMAGGAVACNVYWQLASMASFDNTDVVGNVLAGTAISFTGVGSSLVGRALAKTAVTMTGANISSCGATQPPPPPSCDKDHKHHKHCKHNEHDKPHCDGDGDHDGHDGHDDDGHGNGHDGHDDDNGHGSDHDSPFKR